MSQTENGHTESLDDETAGIDNLIETYRSQLRLTVTSNSKVNDYVNLSQAEFKALTPDECDEIAYILCQHSIYVQNEINRHQAIFKWADRNILAIITKYTDNYGDQFTPNRHKEMRAILENPKAKKLYQIKSLAENNLAVLEDIPRRLDGIIQSFREAKHSKRKQ